MHKQQIELLVGDNAFHGISHISQQRARERSIKDNPSNAEYAAKLVNLSIQNGANGFMFSVSETTLSILKALNQDKKPDLYAIVPYAYEYVRSATKVGGIPGLAKQITRKIIFSKDIFNLAPNFFGLISANPSALLRTYLIYEISRIKSAAGKEAKLKSVLLHEVITDMALALQLDWFFKAYVKFFSGSKIRPGFETRNFPYLVQKLTEWQIDMNKITIAASFNKIGFQMNPSKLDCENALMAASGAQIIAMSVLAAGYVAPSEAVTYVSTLPNIQSIVIGVSKEYQVRETFNLFKNLKFCFSAQHL
jgi:hypothetical protein